MKFFTCTHCGNVITLLHASGAPVSCCGEPMKELVPNTTDAAVEKHVPVIRKEGSLVTVSVGSTAHPMQPEHYIQWIVLETANGFQQHLLKPGDKPEAAFALAGSDSVIAAYAFCNIHGLWQS